MLRQFLPLAYPVNLAYHELLRTFGRQKPQLRVLLYHDVSPGQLNNVAATLRWLQDRWRFLSPQEFESIINGRIPRASRWTATAGLLTLCCEADAACRLNSGSSE